MIRAILTISIIILLLAGISTIIPEKWYSKDHLISMAQEETKQVEIEQTGLTQRNQTNNNTVKYSIFQLPLLIILITISIILIRVINQETITQLLYLQTQHKLTQQEALKTIAAKNTHRMPSNSHKQPYMTIYNKKGHNVSNDS